MNKKELVQNLNTAEKSRDAIENGIQSLEKKLADLRIRANQQLFTTGESDLTKDVLALEGDLKIRYEALQQANAEVESAKLALSDFEKAERYTEAINLSKDVREVMIQINKQLGDTGINNLIDRVFDLSDQMLKIVGENDTSDMMVEVRRARFILTALNHNLYASWVDMRKALPYIGTPTAGTETANYRPGFGRYC